MSTKLSSPSSGGSHPTAQEIFQGINDDLCLPHIRVVANEPYVAGPTARACASTLHAVAGPTAHASAAVLLQLELVCWLPAAAVAACAGVGRGVQAGGGWFGGPK